MKKKSLAVVIISGFVISSVLVLTLIGYAIYMELRDKEAKRLYENDLERIKAESSIHRAR